MALTPEKEKRIAQMFLRDWSLDRISEWGVNAGWTREDAKRVLADRGWALDWNGRLQARFRARELAATAAPLKGLPRPSISECDLEHMLSVGTDHELVAIRRMAVKAQRALDELRRALVLQEEKDAEEVVRRRREEAQRAAEQADPKNWDHGKWGGYLQHKRHNVPVCPPCQVACDNYRPQAAERALAALQSA